jgi:hypothetical protein
MTDTTTAALRREAAYEAAVARARDALHDARKAGATGICLEYLERAYARAHAAGEKAARDASC